MSKDFDLYCFSLTNNQYKFIKELNYIPVGLGKNNFDDGSLLDITNKNQEWLQNRPLGGLGRSGSRWGPTLTVFWATFWRHRFFERFVIGQRSAQHWKIEGKGWPAATLDDF